MRSIIRRSSATPRSDQEFAISLSARDRRRHRADDAPALSRDKTLNVRANGILHRLVAHNPLLEVRPPRLELRLHQHNEFRRRGAEGERDPPPLKWSDLRYVF